MVPNYPDSRDPDAGDTAGNPGLFRRCEKKFIIFAAMEGKLQVSAFAYRYLARGDQGRYAALFADVRQIHGEAITQIDHGGSQATLSQPGSHFKAWRRIEMRVDLAGLTFFPAMSCFRTAADPPSDPVT